MKNNIKKVIKSKGLKSSWVCEQINLNPSVLSLYCSGDRIPNQKRLRQLSKVLNTSIQQLFPDCKIRRINYYDLEQ
jgi:ribosome-binding protein aMBF1 (putative translation factor)